MRSRFVTHPMLHWTMVFIVWFAAMAPTLSHAMRTTDGGVQGEICSVASSGPGGSSTPSSGAAMDTGHCPFCILQAHAPVLPGSAQGLLPGPDRGHEVPRLFLLAPRTLHAWLRAQPRAPPLSA